MRNEIAQQEEEVQDLEALAPVATRTPPFSVFTKWQKRFIVFMVALGGFYSPLSANIYFPALNTLSHELNVSSELMNLTITSYMIFQGLSPTIFGDLADMAGRRPAYVIGFIVYIGACIGLALQTNYAALFVLRCLQSTGCSGTIALASGVVADIATTAERGTFMGIASMGPMVAPALAPVLGGILSQYLGWRSMFWFLVIMAGAYLVIFLAFQPETGRNVVGNGSVPPQGWNMSLLNYLEVRKRPKSADGTELSRTASREEQRLAQAELAKKRRLRWPNPLNALSVIVQVDVGMLLFYNSLVYTAYYCITTSVTSTFSDIYGFDDFQIGLCFIPMGVGCFCAPLLNGRALDWNFKRISRSLNMPVDRKRQDDLKDFPLERARIQLAWPLVFIGNAAVLCYGWVLHARAHLAAPLVLHFIIGLMFTGAFNVTNVLLIDLYPLSPATATAANNLVRCLLGAGGAAVIVQMIRKMGSGPCFTFIAAIVYVASPILFILMKRGPRWREARRQRLLVMNNEHEDGNTPNAATTTTSYPPAAATTTAAIDDDDNDDEKDADDADDAEPGAETNTDTDKKE
ncbi:MFS general substrate transporter [Xylona heveae TC161]|uniref:MFS general substrate transporter n=1 Tax=Xylona heveae (strain CBS 132557 / TC161) TaxID=1328760 RepID=A0A165IY17_XYLHT|nr:MFS general substrate transporter [Xylona heveae TC161]KZF25531.1 MFS general substrate transporter [Xylona heveae TC161]